MHCFEWFSYLYPPYYALIHIMEKPQSEAGKFSDETEVERVLQGYNFEFSNQ